MLTAWLDHNARKPPKPGPFDGPRIDGDTVEFEMPSATEQGGVTVVEHCLPTGDGV